MSVKVGVLKYFDNIFVNQFVGEFCSHALVSDVACNCIRLNYIVSAVSVGWSLFWE